MLRLFSDTRVCALVVMTGALAFALPGLGTHGLLEPQELAVLDSALDGTPTDDASTSEIILHLVTASTSVFGPSELSARAPVALLAALSVLFTYLAAAALGGPRAGALAACIALSMPELVFSSRLLTSVADLALASAMFGYGVCALASPTSRAREHRGNTASRRAWTALARPAPIAALLAGIALAFIGLTTRQPAVTVAPTAWLTLLEPVVYGTFPWIAVLAPAASTLATRWSDDRGARVALSWAAGSVTAAIVVPLALGLQRVPVGPAFAVVVALWVAHRWDVRDVNNVRAPAAAAVILLVAVTLGRDLARSPDGLSSLALSSGRLAFPTDAPAWLANAPSLIGIAFGVMLAASVAYGARGAPNTWSAHAWRVPAFAAVAVALAWSAVVGFTTVPALADAHSERALFDQFDQTRTASSALTVHASVGNRALRLGRGAPTEPAIVSTATAATTAELADALDAHRDAFVIAPRADACALHRALLDRDRPYSVLARSERFFLATNLLHTGVDNLSPFEGVLTRHAPDHVGTRGSIRFENVDLLGVELPDALSRGAHVPVTVHYRVTSRIGRAWRVFVHFDGRGQRFQADHALMDDLCPMTSLRPGDYVRDTFTVDAGDLTTPGGDYQVFTGFFRGGPGSWTNMRVVDGAHDAADRARLGTVMVR